VRALDPRLLRRTRSARPLLTVDVLLGIGTALAVLVQASLLALIVARAFDGVALEALWLDIGLLVAAFVARGACVSGGWRSPDGALPGASCPSSAWR
jgi:hypothetical protein